MPNMKIYEIEQIAVNPCVFRRAVLEGTLEVLLRNAAEESKIIERAFLSGIKNPKNHPNPDACEYFWMECTLKEAAVIAGHLFEAEATAVPPSGETTPDVSRIGYLLDIWSHFRDWIEAGGDTSIQQRKGP